ncbi:hypothetical protein Smp_039010 [Schistosoma mansoni]|uniref:Uncharacterized protein n=1 Tax=Schistosoma mansoni TaxID=6183 RepID=G4LWT0_SCHMA|nr:hypothetical protein Smp_039010 [Schistosoma mansoni]|eukprot:XP_018645720.1 hypothetical protein Smp_039010 [Schistosoma mansoni]
MSHRLTRGQCLIAEVASYLVVAREVAAASSPVNSQASFDKTRSTDMSLGLVDSGSAASKSCPSNNSPHSFRSRFNKVPFQIEKLFDGDEELCSCLPSEFIPSSGNHPGSLKLPPGSSSSPALQCKTSYNFKTHWLPICQRFEDRSSND